MKRSHVLTNDEFAKISHSLIWTFAKTMPEHPHEYIVRRKTVDDDIYIKLFDTIKVRGERRDWHGTSYQYLQPGDGYYYWKMTDDIAESIIINRAKKYVT